MVCIYSIYNSHVLEREISCTKCCLYQRNGKLCVRAQVSFCITNDCALRTQQHLPETLLLKRKWKISCKNADTRSIYTSGWFKLKKFVFVCIVVVYTTLRSTNITTNAKGRKNISSFEKLLS